MSNYTIAQCITRGRQLVEPIDTDAILGHVLGCTREYLMTHPERVLTDEEFRHFEALLVKREDEYPLAYIVGHKEFWSLDIKVTPDVLVPRPDTECLVETALQYCPAGARVLELATGSGAFACALLHERHDISMVVTDISQAALTVATDNIKRYAPLRVEALLSNWFDEVPVEPFDMIIANPPYLSDTDPHLFNEIRYEPRSALVAPDNGLGNLFHIIDRAQAYLKPEGILILEHGYDQGIPVGDAMRAQHYRDVTLVQNLSGNDRVTYGFKTQP